MKETIPQRVLDNIEISYYKQFWGQDSDHILDWQEVADWLPTVDPSVKRMKVRKGDAGEYYFKIEFRKAHDFTAFLLRWS